jgi:hypothetical protein
VSFLAAVLITWIGNTKFAFGGKNSKLIPEDFLHYLAIQSGGALINLGLYTVLILSKAEFFAYPVVALVLASGVAMAANYTLLKRIHFSEDADHGRVVSQISLVVLFCIIGGVVSLCLGQDANWDLKNYHFYNAWAFLNHRHGIDLMPAGIQTFFNPLLDLPYYLLYAGPLSGNHQLLAFVWGIPFGVLIFFTYRTIKLIVPNQTGHFWLEVVVLVLTLGSVTGVALISQVGTTFNEVPIALLVLIALFLILRRSRRPDYWSLIFAGGLIGMAIGLKMTAAIYAPGLVIALVAVQWKSTDLVPKLLTFVIASGVLFLLFWLWWGWSVLSETGNPVFPMFNQFFHSPWASPTGNTDDRFKPKTYRDLLLYPVQWLSPQNRVTELTMADPRVALGLFCVLILFLVLVFDRRRRTQWTSIEIGLMGFVASSYCVWLFLFSIYRYAICLEILMLPCVLICFQKLIDSKLKKLVGGIGLVLLIGFLLIDTIYPNWGRTSFDVKLLQLTKVEKKIPDGSLVVLLGNPLGYLAPILSSESSGLSFLGLNYFTDVNRQAKLGGVVKNRLMSQQSKLIGIISASDMNEAVLLEKYGYRLSLAESWRISTAVDEYLCAPIVSISQAEGPGSLDYLFQ